MNERRFMKKCLIVLTLLACSAVGTIGATMNNTTGTDTQDHVTTTQNTKDTKTKYTITFTVNETTNDTVN